MTYRAPLILKIALLFIFFVISSHTVSASGEYSVVQGNSATLSWSVSGGGSTYCIATTDYPVTSPDDGWSAFWSGSKLYSNSPHTAAVNAPSGKKYTFTCTDPTPGSIPDTTYLVVTAPPLPSCNEETKSHCVLPGGTPSGSRVSGSCESGYTGSCSYTCSSGTWGNPSDNSCTPPGSANFTNSPSCFIAAGANSCLASITWTSTGYPSVTLTDSDNGSYGDFGTGARSSTVTVPYSGGTYNIRIGPYIGVSSPKTILDTQTGTATCAAGSTWGWDPTQSKNVCVGNVVLGDFWDGPAIGRADTKLKMASRDIAFGLERLAYFFGANVRLNWGAVAGGGTITCDIDNGIGSVSKDGGNTPTGPLNVAKIYRYTLTCRNGVGPDQSKWVDVQIFPLPTVTLSASPTTIYKGNSSTLTWISTGADSCTEVGSAFSTDGKKSGNASVSPAITSSYQVTCTGPGGTTTSSPATVTVIVPTATISADPERVVSGKSSTIEWDSTDVTRCDVTGPGFSYPNNKKDKKTANNITTQSVYKINCTTAGDPVSASAIVNVVPGFQEF